MHLPRPQGSPSPRGTFRAGEAAALAAPLAAGLMPASQGKDGERWAIFGPKG